ncbi:hypothetical protein DVH24_037158 [Malus domestica]|uniref:Uncharacterized protein n=1 Tax=Malus domestica TaxID=3750 RepID=A0A498HGC3_MALDO|nr:hypothetical protein DVH24_037158 [Malus domestica]
MNNSSTRSKGRTQCTRLPLYAGSGRCECRLALPPFIERLLPSLEPETYRSWAKALAIAPSLNFENKHIVLYHEASFDAMEILLLCDQNITSSSRGNSIFAKQG